MCGLSKQALAVDVLSGLSGFAGDAITMQITDVSSTGMQGPVAGVVTNWQQIMQRARAQGYLGD